MNKTENSETIAYKLANGRTIYIEVSLSVKAAFRHFETVREKLKKEEDRHLRYSATVGDMAAVSSDAEMNDIAALIDRKERNTPLEKAINKLKPLQKRRLLLHIQHGLTYVQISEIEKVDPSAVGKSIRRALKTLKEHMTR